MREVKRILCAVDLSDATADVAAAAIALAEWCHAAITALHVSEPIFAPVPGLPPLEERVEATERALARECVFEYFTDARLAGVPIDVLVDAGSPARRIVERAAALPADVTVRAPPRASGVPPLMLGSVAEKVLRRASCGVMMVPPHASRLSAQTFSRILCPIDFSDPSLAAFGSAASLARAASAALTLVHVIEWPWQDPPGPSSHDLPPS